MNSGQRSRYWDVETGSWRRSCCDNQIGCRGYICKALPGCIMLSSKTPMEGHTQVWTWMRKYGTDWRLGWGWKGPTYYRYICKQISLPQTKEATQDTHKNMLWERVRGTVNPLPKDGLETSTGLTHLLGLTGSLRCFLPVTLFRKVEWHLTHFNMI